MTKLRQSPAVQVLLFGIMTLAILVLRGLNFGPLHTDIEIFLVWIDTYGVWDYMKHYIEINQRHILAAPRNAVAYWAFGDFMLPYHLIFQASRVLEGVFLAGIVQQLTHRRMLALSAGLALSLSPIRLGALYQTISWGIEATLAMLLASTYVYLLSLQAEHPRVRWRLYGLSFLLYAMSAFTYESGIPWFGVTALAGWFLLRNVPWRQRFKRIALETLLAALTGIFIVILVIFVFEPWTGLAPKSTDSLIIRVAKLMDDLVTFPEVYLNRLDIALNDGYWLWMLMGIMAVGGFFWALTHWLRTSVHPDDGTFFRDFWQLILLGVAMVFSAILVGASNPDMQYAYQDRITFGRSAGIALVYATLIYGVVYALSRMVKTNLFRWQSVAMVVAGLVLIGPGFSWILIYQDEAQESFDEIDNVAEALLDVRCLFSRPLHVVIVTEPDWVVSRFPDAADLIIRQAQLEINDAQGDMTIDILKAGNEGYEDDYIPPEGTCEMNYPSGLCLQEGSIRTSRWTIVGEVPNEDVVIVHYSNDGTVTLVDQLTVEVLDGYNIATSGPGVLSTNADRLLIPFEQMPVPLSGSCPD